MNEENNDLKEINESLKQIVKVLSHISMQTGRSNNSQTNAFSFNSPGNQLKRIADFLLHGRADGMVTYDNQDDRVEELQIKSLSLQVENLKREAAENTKKVLPHYDIPNASLVIENQIIKLSNDSNESKLCEVLFLSMDNMNKEWGWDEIVQLWGEEVENFDRKVIYRTGNRLNDKVAQKTSIKKLFLVTTKTIKISPKHLQK